MAASVMLQQNGHAQVTVSTHHDELQKVRDILEIGGLQNHPQTVPDIRSSFLQFVTARHDGTALTADNVKEILTSGSDFHVKVIA